MDYDCTRDLKHRGHRIEVRMESELQLNEVSGPHGPRTITTPEIYIDGSHYPCYAGMYTNEDELDLKLCKYVDILISQHVLSSGQSSDQLDE